MTLFMDARIPVVLGPLEEAQPEDATLVEGEGFAMPPPILAGPHAPGCICCVPRGPVAEALSNMFLARVRGDVPYFRRVLLVARTAEGKAAMIAALTQDPVVSARFRLG